MEKVLKFGLRILTWIILALLALLLLVILTLQTKPAKKRIAAIVERQASHYIYPQLTIGEIDGNFLSHLKLKNIILTVETQHATSLQNDTIVTIDELQVRYNLWLLFKRKVEIQSLEIIHPFVRLAQLRDSTWNVSHILKPLPQNTGKDTIPSAKPFTIDLSTVKLTDGKMNIVSPDTLIPRKIQNLNASLSVAWGSIRQILKMDDFSLSALYPDLTIKKLTFNLLQDTVIIRLSGLDLQTAENQLKGEIDYSKNENGISSASLSTGPLHFMEFRHFIPGINLSITPELRLDASRQEDSLHANLRLQDQDQTIRLEISSSDFRQWLQNRIDSLLKWQLNVMLDNVHPGHWIGIPHIDYLINSQLTASGKGIDPRTAKISLNASFNHSRFDGKPVDLLNFNLFLDQDNLSGLVEGRGNFGELILKPHIHNLMGNPIWHLELKTQRLDLAPLTGKDSLKSDLNLLAIADGNGFNPKTLSLKGSFFLTESNLQKMKVDSLRARLQYENEYLSVDTLWLKAPGLALNAHGNYSPRANSDLWLSAFLQNTDILSPFLPVKGIQTTGLINARLWGTIDSLNVKTQINLNNTGYQGYTIGKISTSANARITPSDTLIVARVTAQNLGNKSFSLDSVSLGIEAGPDTFFIKGHLANPDLESRFQIGVRLGKKMRIGIYQGMIDYKKQKWELQGSPALITIDSTAYKIDHFRMVRAEGDSLQTISAEGIINRKGKEDFNFKIENLDLKQISTLSGQDLSVSGSLGLNMDLTGTDNSPILKGNFDIKNATLKQYQFKEFDGTMGYKDNRLDVGLKIMPGDSGGINLKGEIPLQVTLDSMKVNYNRHDSVNVFLMVEKFPLAVLPVLNVIKGIRGYLEGNIKMRGTIENPDIKGNMQLKRAGFNIPEYGINYRDMEFKMGFSPQRITLDTFSVMTGKGSLTASGEAGFASVFYKGTLKEAKLNVRLNDFKPVDLHELNAQVSGQASVAGPIGHAVFGGELNIPQSEIYLPALFNMIGKVSAPEIPKPLLVKELEKEHRTRGVDTLKIKPAQSGKRDTTESEYLKQLTGKLQVKIPRNTWIKNENMYVEISGDIEVIKNQKYFELFGTITVVRGQYEFLGRTFTIDQGTVAFEGGQKITPNLNIQASYTLRNTQQVEQKLSVKLTGTPEDPKVAFTLDNSSINEGDALSYILFGTSMDELTTGQQQSLAGAGVGSMAQTLAASLLSSQLTKFLGSKLNVDYIEIKSRSGFSNATVTVGKYITKNLFVSYEQRFGEIQQEGIPQYVVNLEYELFRFLYLRLNNSSIDNGFDIIFKFDSK